MEIKMKPEVRSKVKMFFLYDLLFGGGQILLLPLLLGVWKVKSTPVASTTQVEEVKVHTMHTAILGVPSLEDFDSDCPMYAYYINAFGAHLQYPLKFSCGCNDKKQFGLADISLVDLEGKTYEVRHTPISDDHNNLWFLTAEVKTETAPTAAPPETNGN